MANSLILKGDGYSREVYKTVGNLNIVTMVYGIKKLLGE